jgi:archaellum component FlaC
MKQNKLSKTKRKRINELMDHSVLDKLVMLIGDYQQELENIKKITSDFDYIRDNFEYIRKEVSNFRKKLRIKLNEKVAEKFLELISGDFNVSKNELYKAVKLITNDIMDNINKINNMEDIKQIVKKKEKDIIYCPVCGKFHKDINSEYLKKVFNNNKYAYTAAVLVTHYRHEHISYYDKSWMFRRYRDKNPEYTTHEHFKEKVNNRAKRQIIRKTMKDNILKDSAKIKLLNGFKKLQKNDLKTTELITNSLKKLQSQETK